VKLLPCLLEYLDHMKYVQTTCASNRYGACQYRTDEKHSTVLYCTAPYIRGESALHDIGTGSVHVVNIPIAIETGQAVPSGVQTKGLLYY